MTAKQLTLFDPPDSPPEVAPWADPALHVAPGDELLGYAPDPALLPQAIAALAPRFERRLGRKPTVAWCHPQALNGVREVAGVELRPRAGVPYVGWFFLGSER